MTDYQYQTLTAADRLSQLNAKIHEQERQHFDLMLQLGGVEPPEDSYARQQLNDIASRIVALEGMKAGIQEQVDAETAEQPAGPAPDAQPDPAPTPLPEEQPEPTS